MKQLKTIKTILSYLSILVTIGIVAMSYYFPEQVNDLIPYRFYTVLTNSMEPTIPVESLVLVRHYHPNESIHLQPDDIITFHADRFGHDIVITHRFAHTELDEEGNVIYRTRAEDAENLDAYMTQKKDLIGSYVFHIPYAGRYLEFLKSKHGLILYGEYATILCINFLIRAIWEEKENANEEEDDDTNDAIMA